MTTLIELADAYAEANRTFQSDVLGNIDRGDARAALVAGIEALQAENAGLRSECADYKRQWAEWSSSLDSVMKQRNALRAELDKLKAQEPVGYFDFQDRGFYWAKPTVSNIPISVKVEPLALFSAPQAPAPERNFCERCGKRLVEGHIHTCTPPTGEQG